MISFPNIEGSENPTILNIVVDILMVLVVLVKDVPMGRLLVLALSTE